MKEATRAEMQEYINNLVAEQCRKAEQEADRELRTMDEPGTEKAMAELAAITPSNAQLLASAAKNPAPQEWYDEPDLITPMRELLEASNEIRKTMIVRMGGRGYTPDEIIVIWARFDEALSKARTAMEAGTLTAACPSSDGLAELRENVEGWDV